MGLGTGGMWLVTSRAGHNLMWRNSWPPDTIVDLVSSNDLEDQLTNFYLKLAALILH